MTATVHPKEENDTYDAYDEQPPDEEEYPGDMDDDDDGDFDLDAAIAAEIKVKSEPVSSDTGSHDNYKRLKERRVSLSSIKEEEHEHVVDPSPQKAIPEDHEIVKKHDLILSSKRILKGHSGGVTSVLISETTHFVLTASQDKSIVMWDTITGEKLRAFEGHEAFVSCMSLTEDESVLATGSWDRQAILWDVNSVKPLHTLKGHEDMISSIVIARDGSVVITGSFDKRAIIWNARTGEQLRTLKGHTGAVSSVAISADASLVVTGSWDKTAILWNIGYGKIRSFEEHQDQVTCVAISSDGSLVATGSKDKLGILWSAETGGKLRVFDAHLDGLTSIIISNDKSLVLTGSRDKTAMVWDLMTGEVLRCLKHHNAAVSSVSLSSDALMIMLGSDDRSASIWDSKVFEQSKTWSDFDREIAAVAVSTDGSFIVIGTWDKTLLVQDARKNSPVRSFSGHQGAVNAVAISSDNSMIVSGSNDKMAIVWNAEDGRILYTLQGHDGHVISVNISIDGSILASGSNDHTVMLWDLHNGKRLHVCRGHTDIVSSVLFNADAQILFSGSWDNHVLLWNTKTGHQIRYLDGHEGGITSMAINVEGTILAVACRDHRVFLWDVYHSDKMRILKGHKDIVSSVAMTQHGDYVITASWDRKTIIWDVKTGDILRTLEGHEGAISTLSMSEQGATIVTGGWDRKVIANFEINIDSRLSRMLTPSIPMSSIDLLPIYRQDLEVAKKASNYNWSKFVNNLAVREMLLRDVQLHGNSKCFNLLHLAVADRHANTLIQSLLAIMPHVVFLERDGLAMKDSLHSSFMNTADSGNQSGKSPRSNVGDMALNAAGAAVSAVAKFYLISNRKIDQVQTCRANLLSRALLYDSITSMKMILDCYLDLLTMSTDNFNNSFAISGAGSDSSATSSGAGGAQYWKMKYDKLYRPYLGDDADEYVQHSQHMSDLVDINEICEVAVKTPELFLQFVEKLTTVRNYHFTLKDSRQVMTNELIISGSKDRSPEYFWDRLLATKRRPGAVDTTDEVPVSPYLIPIKNIAALDSRFLATIVHAAESLDSYLIFDNEVVKTVIDFKWNTFIRPLVMRDFFLHIMLCILFLFHALYFHYYVEKEGWHPMKIAGVVILATTGVLCLYFSVHEVQQFVIMFQKQSIFGKPTSTANISASTAVLRQLKPAAKKRIKSSSKFINYCRTIFALDYFEDGWNWIHIVSNSAIMATLLTQWQLIQSQAKDHRPANILAAATMPMLAAEILFYLGGLQDTGPLIRMIIKITKGIIGFCVILFIILLAFAGSFVLLYQEYADVQSLGFDGYTRYDRSLMTVYGFLLGNYNIEDMEKASNPHLAMLLLALFMFVVVIVLLNLLIAIMGDKYDEVQENASAEATYALAKLVSEYEGLISDLHKTRNRELWYPTWIQVLKKDFGDSDSNAASWMGKVKAIKESVTEATMELQEQMKKEFKVNHEILQEKMLDYKRDTYHRIADVQRETNEKLRNLDAKMNRIDGKLNIMIAMLQDKVHHSQHK